MMWVISRVTLLSAMDKNIVFIARDGSWELQRASLLHFLLIAFLAVCEFYLHCGCLVMDIDDATS